MCVCVMPCRLEVPKDDAPLEDDEVAYGMMGSLMGMSAAAQPVASPFNIEGLQMTAPFPLATMTTTNGPMSMTGGGQEGDRTFSLPPLVKTGKEIIGEIKMPALPLKANLKKKQDEDENEMAMNAATAYLGDEVATTVPDGIPYPTGDESKALVVMSDKIAVEQKGHMPIARRRPRYDIFLKLIAIDCHEEKQ